MIYVASKPLSDSLWNLPLPLKPALTSCSRSSSTLRCASVTLCCSLPPAEGQGGGGRPLRVLPLDQLLLQLQDLLLIVKTCWRPRVSHPQVGLHTTHMIQTQGAVHNFSTPPEREALAGSGQAGGKKDVFGTHPKTRHSVTNTLITEYWNAPIESFQLCTLQTLNVAKRKVKPRLKQIKEAISCHNEAIWCWTYMQSTTIGKLPVNNDWLSDTRKFKQNDVITGEGQVFKGTLVAL